MLFLPCITDALPSLRQRNEKAGWKLRISRAAKLTRAHSDRDSANSVENLQICRQSVPVGELHQRGIL